MNRMRVFLVIMLYILALSGTVFATTIKNSKHDLSFSSTGATIKSAASGTSEICVFCHTPHSAAAVVDAPLWNKDIFSGAQPAYAMYSSDVLDQLSYPAAELPVQGGKAVHIRKTRLCLSCHDGTIALGALKNLPAGFSSDIPMSGATTMPTTAAGYIGIDLRDDHPVSISYTPGSDPELKTVHDGIVKTFDSGGVKYVECTSCHEPHNPQYGNFLVAANTGSAICTACHSKAGFTGSIHDTATLAYSPPDGTGAGFLGTSVGDVKCMSCHFPHKAGVTAASPTTPNPGTGRYLLSFREEASCFNNPNDRWGTSGAAGACHGSGASGTNALRRNIESIVSETSGKAYKHRVADTAKSGRHEATEGRETTGAAKPNWTNSGALWHVECQDCHNSHTAQGGTRSLGTNAVAASSPLYGAGGARVSSPPSWTIPTGTYTYIEPTGLLTTAGSGVQFEHEICFKCHSDFAWGTTPPQSPSLGSAMTNQALEFLQTNPSYHPVVQANANTQGTYVGGWNSTNQTMYCSDCHGNNTAPPAGPHGSSYRSILKAPYDPATVGSLSSEICFQCHDYNTYYGNGAAANTGFRDARNLHYQHMNPAGFPYQGGIPKRCTGCHANPPHGMNRPHIISLSSDGAPYGTYSSITSFTDASPGTYTGTNCSATTCHSGAHP